MVFGICIGFLAGALVVNLYLKESEHTNMLLKKTINNLEEDLKRANSRVEQRDTLIHDLQKENAILLENSAELRSGIKKIKSKVTDLENNIELLKNNLSNENKELISDDQSEN